MFASGLGRLSTPAPRGMSLGVVDTRLGEGDGVGVGDGEGEGLGLGDATTGLMTMTLGPVDGVGLGYVAQDGLRAGSHVGLGDGLPPVVAGFGDAATGAACALDPPPSSSKPTRRSGAGAARRARQRGVWVIASGRKYGTRSRACHPYVTVSTQCTKPRRPGPKPRDIAPSTLTSLPLNSVSASAWLCGVWPCTSTRAP